MQRVLVALQIGKITCLQHFDFCNLTLWMLPALNARSRRPVRPSPLHATAMMQCKWAFTKHFTLSKPR